MRRFILCSVTRKKMLYPFHTGCVDGRRCTPWVSYCCDYICFGTLSGCIAMTPVTRILSLPFNCCVHWFSLSRLSSLLLGPIVFYYEQHFLRLRLPPSNEKVRRQKKKDSGEWISFTFGSMSRFIAQVAMRISSSAFISLEKPIIQSTKREDCS